MVTSSTELVTGDGRIINVGGISQLFRDTFNLSSPSTGSIKRLGENNFSLTSVFSTLDCDTLERIKTFKVYSLNTCEKPNVGRCIESVRCISEQNLCTDLATVTSENGRFLARLKEPSSNSSASSNCSGKRQLLEIWDRARHLKTIDISDLDAHGLINVDSQFKSIRWCPYGQQDKLLYVCQRKQTKSLNFFKQEKPGSQLSERGQEHVHIEDWGDTLDEVKHNIVAILDLSKDFHISTIDVEGFSLGNALWMDGGNKIVSVAYKEEPRKLGLIHCNNRSTKIIIHDLTQSIPQVFFCLEDNEKCFHTPRVDHSGMKLVYLANPVFGVHHHSVELHLHDIGSNQDALLIDKNSKESLFFVEDLPSNCFSCDDKNILLVKSDHLLHHMCLFNLEEMKLCTIKFPTSGLTVQDFQHDIILATGSEINATPTLFVAALNSANSAELVAWHQIEEYVHLDEIEYESHIIPTEDGSSFVSTLMIRPNLQLLTRLNNLKIDQTKLIVDQAQLPTIVSVHGGPSAAFFAHYMEQLVFNARLGLKTLLINYRGSTGISEDYTYGLCGKVGQMDVGDCLHVIRHFVQNKSINPDKLIISGGSHGGFLAAHLSCLNEFKFTSAIIRNPVINLATLYEVSDIPDWTKTYGLNSNGFDFKQNPSIEELVQLYQASPMSRATMANVPTLMHLGAKDKRVPMCQGLRWVELLKARGVPTQCKVFHQDRHALDRPETFADSLISIAIWILTHL